MSPASERHDARASTRSDLGLGEGIFAVGSIARWHEHKDIPTLLRAVRIAADQGVPIRCLLVGRALNQRDEELCGAIRAAECELLVAGLGPRSDIPNLTRAFDLHLISSRSEAFPNVVAETMLSGTPNAVTDAGDAAAIVDDTGWVVPPASPQKLAQAIVEAYGEWLRKSLSWQRRRDASRERIVANYDFGKMASAYAEIWHKVTAAAA